MAQTTGAAAVPKRDAVDRFFDVALIIKAIDGLLETLGGLLLLLASPAMITSIIETFTRRELAVDPHGHLANRLLHFAESTELSKAALTFFSIYLLLHGLAKLVLVFALYREKVWAYPTMIIFLAVFIVYQIYVIAVHRSGTMVALTLFDAVFLWLTWREWGREKARRAAAAVAA